MRENLTDRLLESSRVLDSKEFRILNDTKIVGFAVRINRDGTKTFYYRGRVNGRERQITIGRYPVWSVSQARFQAQEYAQQMNKGIDPTLEKQKQRNAPTFRQAFDELYWTQNLARRNADAQRDERAMFRDYLLPLATMRLADITPRDCQKIHFSMTQDGKATRANRVLRVMRSVFNRAIDAGWISDNPTRAIVMNREMPRERFLTRDEHHRFVDALNSHPNRHAADIVSFLLLTGARRGETLKATWDQFDLVDGVWMKPSHHTKQKRIHTVPLSPDALEILRRRKATVRSPFVFPQIDNHTKPTKEFRTFWKNVLKTAGVKDFRVHDLRHHYASVLVNSGASLPVIGKLLGHTQQATTQRYAHLTVEPLRDATNMAAQRINLGRPIENETERTIQ